MGRVKGLLPEESAEPDERITNEPPADADAALAALDGLDAENRSPAELLSHAPAAPSNDELGASVGEPPRRGPGRPKGSTNAPRDRSGRAPRDYRAEAAARRGRGGQPAASGAGAFDAITQTRAELSDRVQEERARADKAELELVTLRAEKEMVNRSNAVEMCEVLWRGAARVAQSARGWTFTEDEIKTLGKVWGEYAAPYMASMGGPLGIAVITTIATVGPHVAKEFGLGDPEPPAQLELA